MNRYSALHFTRRATALTAAMIMFVAVAIPILINNSAHAAQLQNRSVDIDTSLTSATATYTVDFEVQAATAVLGIVVDICMNSPIVGVSCTTASGVTNGPANPATITVDDNTATTQSVNFDVHTNSTATGRLILTHATGLTNLAADDNVSFSFTADNPSVVGSYYARIITTSTEAAASGYDPTNGPSTTNYIDNGSVALSTVDQLTITARVQEELEFCVAALTAANITTMTNAGGSDGSCSSGPMSTAGTTVDMGVIDSSTPVPGTSNATPVPAVRGGNDTTGAMVVRTNAVNGVTISYFAEEDADNGASDTHQLGALRIADVDCDATVTVTTDGCFYSVADDGVGGTDGLDLSAAGEGFGANYGTDYQTDSASIDSSASLSPQGDFGTAGANEYIWDSSGGTAGTELIASSSTVLDYVLVEFDFGARTAATTPTGTYDVVSTYIATATF